MAAFPEAHPALPAPAPTLRRDWLLLALSLLLLLAVVLPPLVNLGRYQHRIADTMSRSLGRPVTMGAISLRLLPMPAFVLSDVVVNEDPAFGAEPALRAPSVVAELRLTSLWRGRFEVSHVAMSDASLNLVRDAAGRWNVGSVLLQASHIPNAPTGQRRPGPAPRFPYIEITDSRLNLKQGAEKLPYSLLNANLSMWLAEPDLWRLKLDAQPARTDVEMGLSDSGLVRVEGTLHRATALGHMPIALHADWSNAPLGQVTRLLMGHDGGWRGDLHATADVTGELDSLAVKTRLAIANLHREEFTPAEPFTVDATCAGSYSRAAHSIADLACRWPVGGGVLLLTGNVLTGQIHMDSAHPKSDRTDSTSTAGIAPTLALTARHVPASFFIAAAGLASSDFAPAFRISGDLSGTLSYTSLPGQAPLYAGSLEAPQLTLAAAGSPLVLRAVRLAAAAPAPTGAATLLLTSLPLDLDGETPAQVNAQLTTEGFLLHASGSASVVRLEEFGRAAGLLPLALQHLAPYGAAEFDVTHTGSWQGQGQELEPLSTPAPARAASRHPLQTLPANSPHRFATVPVTNGWLRLHNAQYTPPFLREAILLPVAQATFLPGRIDWNVPAATIRDIPMQVTASYPLACAVPPCATHFRASVASLDGAELTAALAGTGQNGRLVDALLSRLGSRTSGWPSMIGTIHADTFTLGRLALRQADATLSIEGSSFTLEKFNARALGGSVTTDGSMKIEGGVPAYSLNTAMTGVSAAAAGSLFHEEWGPGTLTLSAHLQLAGRTSAQLADSAQGSFRYEWLHGALGSGTPFARFAAWTGEGTIGDSALTFTSGQLTPATSRIGVQLVKGSIGLDRAMTLQIGDPSTPDRYVTVTGTISHPAE